MDITAADHQWNGWRGWTWYERLALWIPGSSVYRLGRAIAWMMGSYRCPFTPCRGHIYWQDDVGHCDRCHRTVTMTPGDPSPSYVRPA